MKLKIIWIDDTTGQMSAPFIEDAMTLNSFEPDQQPWQQRLVLKLKEKWPIVRNNAQLVVMSSYRNDLAAPTYTLEGSL